MKKILLSIGMMLLLVTTGFGQSTGDIAFIGFNADGNDDLVFVVLETLPGSLDIYITDNEWDGSAMTTGEGFVVYTTPSSGLAIGTVVSLVDIASSGSLTASVGSIADGSGSLNISGSGDEIYAYTGTGETSVTTFLAAITNASSWAASELSNTNLTSGTTALVVGDGNDDNGEYTGSREGDLSTINTNIQNVGSNWTTTDGSGDQSITFTTTSLIVTDRVSILGDAGWRLLSLPKASGVVTDVSDDSPVQGVSGGSDTGSASNFKLYQSGSAFADPTDVSTAWGDGFGFAMYFYNNTTNGSSALPITLDASGSEPASDVAVTLNTTASGSTAGSGASDSKYTLVGNPFASNFDLNAITVTGDGIQANVQFWNDGTSSYSAQDRTTPYIVSPWQGFWVEVTSANTTTGITFPTSGKSTSAATGTFFSKEVANRGDVSFTLSSEGTFDEAIRLSFRDYATQDFDIADASKLNPLATTYATMAFLSNDRLKAVESLPYNLEETVELKLEEQLVGVSGEFTLDWSGLETIPADWTLTFHDFEEGTSVDMREVSEYTFTAEADDKEKVNPLSILSGPTAQTMKSKSSGNTRFGITLQPNTAVSNEPDNTPLSFGLEQNYPNPFNPSTTINYTIAKSGQVSLSVYNLMGQKVAELVNEVKGEGSYNVSWNAAGAASGMYYYRLEAAGQTLTRKMTLIK
ncbi:MAG: T9SS type A sorting domain-containing protein [Balneolaceae bacterium]